MGLFIVISLFMVSQGVNYVTNAVSTSHKLNYLSTKTLLNTCMQFLCCYF